MAEPHLSSLTIKGFRCFEKLELRKLGHVNLLVGKNGVGKSSVLDAVRLYASQFEFSVIAEILNSRGESWNPEELNCLSPLFRGRPDLSIQPGHLWIGPLHFVAARAAAPLGEMDWNQTIHALLGPYAETEAPNGAPKRLIPIVIVHGGSGTWRQAIFSGQLLYENLKDRAPLIPFQYISDKGLTHPQLESLGDGIAATDDELLIEEALRLVRPEIKRFTIELRSTHRVRVRLADAKELVLLASLGGGAVRAFGLALALVRAKGGFLLIDEFENGLHYSVQQKLWAFVMRVARELNVQVFATTHSDDCINSFGRAASSSGSSGVLTRLTEFKGEIVARQVMSDDLVMEEIALPELR